MRLSRKPETGPLSGNTIMCGARLQSIAALPVKSAKCILRGNWECQMEIPGARLSLKLSIEGVRGPAGRWPFLLSERGGSLGSWRR
jgi:hypothetical protein